MQVDCKSTDLVVHVVQKLRAKAPELGHLVYKGINLDLERTLASYDMEVASSLSPHFHLLSHDFFSFVQSGASVYLISKSRNASILRHHSADYLSSLPPRPSSDKTLANEVRRVDITYQVSIFFSLPSYNCSLRLLIQSSRILLLRDASASHSSMVPTRPTQPCSKCSRPRPSSATSGRCRIRSEPPLRRKEAYFLNELSISGSPLFHSSIADAFQGFSSTARGRFDGPAASAQLRRERRVEPVPYRSHDSHASSSSRTRNASLSHNTKRVFEC